MSITYVVAGPGVNAVFDVFTPSKLFALQAAAARRANNNFMRMPQNRKRQNIYIDKL
jgi:hypothetical protein